MASRRLIQSAFALSLLTGNALAAWPSGCEDLSGLPINFNVDWQCPIKPSLNAALSLAGRGTSCHNGGQLDGNLDLTDEGIDAIYKIVGTYALPGDPLGSHFFEKINCEEPSQGGTRMPASAPGLAGVPLTAAQQGLIYDWIAQGAKGEPSDEAPIPRDFLFRDGVESLR